MNNEVLMAVAGDAPVESPFEHGKPLISRQRREGRFAIDVEDHLRRDPPSETLWPFDADVEVREASAILGSVVCIVERNAVRDGVQAGANAGDDGSRAQAQAASVQLLPQGTRGEVGD